MIERHFNYLARYNPTSGGQKEGLI